MWMFKKKKPRKQSESQDKGFARLLTPVRSFTYNEILNITGNFGEVLSTSASSTVYHGRLQEGGLHVAVKKLEPSSLQFGNILGELKILTRVHHKNLVSLVGLCEEGDDVMLVYECMTGGSLGHALSAKNSELTWRKRLQIALDSAIGIHYLHTACKPPVTHRNIKSRTILLDENMEAKLSGFSLGKDETVDGSENTDEPVDGSEFTDGAVTTQVIGTMGYMDPTYICTGILTQKSDVYSFGVVLFEIITGKPAMVTLGSDDRRHLPKWFIPMLKRGDMDKVVDPQSKGHCNIESVRKVAELAKAAILEDPRRRPDMSDIVSTLQEALRMEISRVDTPSRSEISSGESFTETPHNPIAGHFSRSLSLGNTDSDSSSYFGKVRSPDGLGREVLAKPANRITKAGTSSTEEAGTSSTKEAGIAASGIPGRTADRIPAAMEAKHAISAVEVQLSHNIDETTMVSRPARRFSYNEIVSITGNFERVVGRGGFATVYYGQLQGGLKVAVKKIRESGSLSSKEVLAEVKLLMRIHHRHLVSLVGFCEEGNQIILVFEYMASGDLYNMLRAKASQLTWKKRLRIALGAATGLEYLHTGCKPAVIHGDIKSANILLDENDEAKLADFGMSRAGLVDGSECSTIQMSKVVGTFGYLDPAYLESQALTKKSDVYSFGVVLFELITGKPARVPCTETNEKRPLANWVMPMLIDGEIESLLDPVLKENCNMESVWEVAVIAWAAVKQRPSERPGMPDIVSKLKGALKLEIPWVGHGFEISQ